MSELITSNAYNFSEYITSGVDARTGTFSITLSLGEFISHKTSGPVLDMKLTYSEQSSFDNGFGRGWSLPISRFSSTNNMLRLSNGQAFKIQWNAAQNEYDLEYRRLKDIRVVRDSSSDNMIVLYKNGRTETLDLEEGLLRESTNESGLAIKFDYRLFNGEYVVSKIYDDSGTELEIDAWTDQWVATITHRLNGSAEKIFNINKTANGQFKRLSRFDINGDDQVRIDYLWISTGFDVIVGVEHPSGLIDEVTYNPNGHYMPTNAPFQTVPNVTTHRVETGDNQPAKVSRYTYSDANYLGYASDAAWIAGEDTLFRARNNYKYTVTETINTKVVVERTYNKYHLLELEEHSFDGVVFKKDTNEYFANLDVGIGSQPPKYSLLKSTVATFYAGGSSRPVVTNYDYDDYGNQTYLEENSGDRVIHDYYPVGGDSGNAPPAPNGIVSLLKQTQFLPINTGNGEVVRTTSYKYKSLINLDDPALHFAVVIEQKAENQTIQYSYHESSSAPLEYGRVKSETSTINSYSELVEFAYTFNANTFLSSQTVTTHDGIQSKSDELLRLYDAQPLERTEYLDLSDSSDYITNTFDYDERGRITAETAAKNTAYEAKVITSYVIGDGVNSATSTDSKGNIKTEKYNNAGQLIQTLASDSNGTLRVTKDIYYNEFGLPSSEKSQDWNGGVFLYTQEIQYEYDHFGQVNEITHSDGRKEYIDQDPVTLISKHTMQGLIVESTTFNERGLEIEKKTEGSSGQIITLSTMAYDGYGNLIMSEDTDGNITKMSYDKLDRVSEIERTVDGQKVIESYEYADFVNEELPTKLSIGSETLGTRNYDGMGRVVQSDINGVVNTISYKGNHLVARSLQTPNGGISLDNNRYLQSPEKISIDSTLGSKSQEFNYEYDSVSGLPLNVSSSMYFKANSYNALGQLEAETSIINGESRDCEYVYSLNGALLSKTDFYGNSESYEYDSNGRPSVITADTGLVTIVTSIFYDAHSRAIKYVTTPSNGTSKTVDIELNDLGMETRKTVTIGTSTKLSEVVTDFNTSLQISERVTTNLINGSNRVTTELMQYDEFNRLVLFTCEGFSLPVNELGYAIKSQRFSYDPLGNITEVISDFDDGSTNTATFSFIGIKLTRVSNSHPNIASFDVTYDSAGNVVSDGSGFTYQYDALNKISSAYDESGTEVTSYLYGPEGRLISQDVGSESINLRYQNDKLINEQAGSANSYEQSVAGVLTNFVVQDGSESISYHLLNTQDSLVGVVGDDDSLEEISYTPFGENGVSHG